MNRKAIIMLSAMISCLMTSCSSIPTRRAEASAITHRNKAELSSEFIGIAGDRAFKLVKLVSLFGGHPTEVIWWCPIDELSASEIASLRAKADGGKIP